MSRSRPAPPPASPAASTLDRPCPRCGAAPGVACAGLRAGASHPSRRPPRGRWGAPPRAGEAASRRLSVRVTPAELATIDAAAAAAGLERGEWVRRTLIPSGPHDPPDDDTP